MALFIGRLITGTILNFLTSVVSMSHFLLTLFLPGRRSLSALLYIFIRHFLSFYRDRAEIL